jgi:hypothetical protein
MDPKTTRTTRRTILIGAAALSGLPVLAATQSAYAAGTVPQASAHYQNKPNANGQHCGKCNYFLPGASATANGQCKLVAGVISPNGWCQLYAAKPGG